MVSRLNLKATVLGVCLFVGAVQAADETQDLIGRVLSTAPPWGRVWNVASVSYVTGIRINRISTVVERLLKQDPRLAERFDFESLLLTRSPWANKPSYRPTRLEQLDSGERADPRFLWDYLLDRLSHGGLQARFTVLLGVARFAHEPVDKIEKAMARMPPERRALIQAESKRLTRMLAFYEANRTEDAHLEPLPLVLRSDDAGRDGIAPKHFGYAISASDAEPRNIPPSEAARLLAFVDAWFEALKENHVQRLLGEEVLDSKEFHRDYRSDLEKLHRLLHADNLETLHPGTTDRLSEFLFYVDFPFLQWAVRRFLRDRGGDVEALQEDFESEAVVKFWKALRLFDPYRPKETGGGYIRFTSYLHRAVETGLNAKWSKYVQGAQPAHTNKHRAEVYRAAQELAGSERSIFQVSNEEIAAALGMTPEKVGLWRRTANAVSIDAPFSQSNDGDLADLLEDKQATQDGPREDIGHLLPILSTRQRAILILSNGLYSREVGDEGLTLDEVGLRLGVTRERVRQILSSIVVRLMKRAEKSTSSHASRSSEFAAEATLLRLGVPPVLGLEGPGREVPNPFYELAASLGGKAWHRVEDTVTGTLRPPLTDDWVSTVLTNAAGEATGIDPSNNIYYPFPIPSGSMIKTPVERGGKTFALHPSGFVTEHDRGTARVRFRVYSTDQILSQLERARDILPTRHHLYLCAEELNTADDVTRVALYPLSKKPFPSRGYTLDFKVNEDHFDLSAIVQRQAQADPRATRERVATPWDLTLTSSGLRLGSYRHPVLLSKIVRIHAELEEEIGTRLHLSLIRGDELRKHAEVAHFPLRDDAWHLKIEASSGNRYVFALDANVNGVEHQVLLRRVLLFRAGDLADTPWSPMSLKEFVVLLAERGATSDAPLTVPPLAPYEQKLSAAGKVVLFRDKGTVGELNLPASYRHQTVRWEITTRRTLARSDPWLAEMFTNTPGSPAGDTFVLSGTVSDQGGTPQTFYWSFIPKENRTSRSCFESVRYDFAMALEHVLMHRLHRDPRLAAFPTLPGHQVTVRADGAFVTTVTTQRSPVKKVKIYANPQLPVGSTLTLRMESGKNLLKKHRLPPMLVDGQALYLVLEPTDSSLPHSFFSLDVDPLSRSSSIMLSKVHSFTPNAIGSASYSGEDFLQYVYSKGAANEARFDPTDVTPFRRRLYDKGEYTHAKPGGGATVFTLLGRPYARKEAVFSFTTAGKLRELDPSWFERSATEFDEAHPDEILLVETVQKAPGQEEIFYFRFLPEGQRTSANMLKKITRTRSPHGNRMVMDGSLREMTAGIADIAFEVATRTEKTAVGTALAHGFSLLADKEQSRFVDLGAGDGLLTSFLAPYFHSVTAVERGEEKVRAMEGRQMPNATIYNADYFDYLWREDSRIEWDGMLFAQSLYGDDVSRKKILGTALSRLHEQGLIAIVTNSVKPVALSLTDIKRRMGVNVVHTPNQRIAKTVARKTGGVYVVEQEIPILHHASTRVEMEAILMTHLPASVRENTESIRALLALLANDAGGYTLVDQQTIVWVTKSPAIYRALRGENSPAGCAGAIADAAIAIN